MQRTGAVESRFARLHTHPDTSGIRVGHSSEGIAIDGRPLGARGDGQRPARRVYRARTAYFQSHVAAQLSPAPADERHPYQLSLSLAGTLVDTNHAKLSGARSGPDRQPGEGALYIHPVLLSCMADGFSDYSKVR